VAAVKGDDPAKKSEAAAQLMGVDFEKFHEQLAPLAVGFAADSDPNLRNLGVHILTKTATVAQVPLLLKILRSDDSVDKSSVGQTLGRLRDPRAIEPLADLIVHGSIASQVAADALSQYGSSVEETALAMLKEKHRQTRSQACRILRDCGTAKSIEPLRAALTKADGDLITEVAETLRAIRQRGEEAEKLVL
jgi:HEAT repeat protein